MKYPILLKGRTMESAGMIRPLSMQQAWKEDGDTTANIVMRIEDEDIPISAWLKVFSPNGMSAVLYVKTKKTDYVARTVTYTLEHCFHLLEEMIVFGEITPEIMGGSETEVSVRNAIQYLLNQQTTPLFQLGRCDFTTAEGWKFTNSDVYSDLMSLTDSILDCMWEFSMDTLPWTISLVPWETADTMEMRMNRNLSSLNISLDKSNMYTRVYPTGKNNLHINGDYIDMNTETWGVIGKIITDGSIDSEPLLRAWATKMLKRNATPALNVSINAMDLSTATGESLDRFVLGRVCRIPLPEYGTVIRDRIISVVWRDVCQDEESCTVNMANERKTVQGVLNEIARGGGAGSKKGGHAAAKGQQEQEDKISAFYTEYERTNKEINERAVYWDEDSAILRAAGMHRDNEGNIIYATDNVRMIGSQIVSLDDRASMMVGRYNITEEKLRRYAGKSAFPDTGTEGLFYVDVSTSKTYVWKDGKYNEIQVGQNGEGYFVKAGEIAIALNESGDAEAHIDAKKVILGQAQLSQMDLDDWAGDAVNGEGVFAKYLTVKKLTAREISTMFADIGNAQLDKLWATNLEVEGQAIVTDGLYVDWGVRVNNDGSGAYTLLNVTDAEVNGNTLTIHRLTGGDVTFSKATTLEEHSPAWSGGVLTIDAKQTTGNLTTTVASYTVGFGNVNADTHMSVTLGTPSAHTNEKYVNVPVYVNRLTDGVPEPPYHYNDIAVNATIVYNNVTVTKVALADNYSALGETDTRTDIYIQGTASNGKKKDNTLFQLAHPTTKVNGHYVVNLKQGSDIIGRINVDTAYNAGYDTGAGTAFGKTATEISADPSQQASAISLSADKYYKIVVMGKNHNGNEVAGTDLIVKTAKGGSGAPTITFTEIASTAVGNISVKATANNEDTTETVRLSVTTYTNASGTLLNCVEAKNGTDLVGRISIQEKCNDHYTAGVKSVWLYQKGTASQSQGTLAYDTYYAIGDSSLNIITNSSNNNPAVWKTPADRYDAGYTAGVAYGKNNCGHYTRGSFYCTVSTSGSVTTVTLTRTYSYHGNPSVFSNGKNVTIYTT